jgi:hypothetical protein
MADRQPRRAPNKSVEEPLVAAARVLARGNRGFFSRLQLVDMLTSQLKGYRRRLRRQVIQAVISRLIAAGFFRRTREEGVLRFAAMTAPLPWDAFVEQKRAEAVQRLQSRLQSVNAEVATQASRLSAARATRRSLRHRLRKLGKPTRRT